jgi:hypothetical protein
VEQARAALNRIIGETDRILHALTGVQDVTPWWATMLGRVAIAAAVLGVLGLLIYLGIGPLTRAFFNWLGWFIPKPTQAGAKLLAEDKPVEAVAALRTDSTFNTAYLQAKKQAASKPPTSVDTSASQARA